MRNTNHVLPLYALMATLPPKIVKETVTSNFIHAETLVYEKKSIDIQYLQGQREVAIINMRKDMAAEGWFDF